MKENDWVYIHLKGVWQIIRIIKIKSLFPVEQSSTLFLCKRFLNEKGNRSFSIASVHKSLATPITTDDKIFVERFIAENPKIFEEFKKYYKPINTLLNLSFYVQNKKERTLFKKFIEDRFIDIKDGYSDETIAKILSDKMKDKRSSIKNITVQFVSVDSKVTTNKFLFTKLNILDF